MAFIDDQDKLLQDGQQQDQQQTDAGNSAGQTTDPNPTLGGGGSSDVGTNVSTAGVGAGGQGGWTNIQAYLEANKDNNTTGDALNSSVGGTLDSEKNRIESDSQSKLAEGQSKVDEAKATHAATGQYLGGSSTYGGDTENTLKQNLNGSYTPQQADYTIGNDAYQYGQQLGSDEGFDSLLNQTYNNAAGGQISAGQRTLQHQLDMNNPQLAQNRSDLNARYKALEGLATSKAADTNAATAGFANQYKDELTGAKNDIGTARTAAEAQLKDYTNSKQQGYDQLRSQYESLSRLLGMEANPTDYKGTDQGDFAPKDDQYYKDQISQLESQYNDPNLKLPEIQSALAALNSMKERYRQYQAGGLAK
jgi:hypothetical protein